MNKQIDKIFQQVLDEDCADPLRRFADLVRQDERQALAQPEQDKQCKHCGGKGCVACDARCLPKQWVGLTDDERRHFNNRLSVSGVAEEIEAKLKEKNGGFI